LLSKCRIAVVGATGRVGREFLSILQDSEISPEMIRAIASNRFAGKLLDYAGTKIEVVDIECVDFSQFDIAFFSAGSNVSK
jgi:aspartate-semialdehyde dehydrogenase